jgi:hypothetical protein
VGVTRFPGVVGDVYCAEISMGIRVMVDRRHGTMGKG